MSDDRESAWDEVWEIVREIPAGRVMSYGQVASLCERPLSPRAVGWAMHACPDDVPWHRVVNARGECSTDRVAGGEAGRQRRRLEAEGVGFGSDGRIAVDNKEVDEVDLQLVMSDRLAANSETGIRIKADGRVDAARVVEVMELIEAVGARRVLLLTLGPER